MNKHRRRIDDHSDFYLVVFAIVILILFIVLV
jgi:hypothetical protein